MGIGLFVLVVLLVAVLSFVRLVVFLHTNNAIVLRDINCCHFVAMFFVLFSPSFFLLLILFTSSASSLPLPLPLPLHPQTEPLDAAIQALSDSGFKFMSRALQRAPLPQITKSSPLTIFAPTDSAFRRHFRPPDLALLYFHLCPLKIPRQRIRTLPHGAKIKTHLSITPLIVTTGFFDWEVTLNRVAVNQTPVFDSGPIVIYAVDKLFDPLFRHSPPPYVPIILSENLKCSTPRKITDVSILRESLEMSGYPVMGDFLDLQLVNDAAQTELTVFAPSLEGKDEDILPDFRDHASFLHRHVVPCKLSLSDLRYHAENQILLPTFLKGYTINVTRTVERDLLLNGVRVENVYVYSSDQVVINGISRMLEEIRIRGTNPFSDPEFRRSVAENNLIDTSGSYGRLKDISQCSASIISRRPNGNLTIVASNICVDWRKVDKIIFDGSVLPQLSPKERVRYGCEARFAADYSLASDAVRAIGDSFMSAFLDMQLIDMGGDTKLTVLAPLDDNDKRHWLGYLHQYKKHVISCRVTWSDLVTLEEGAVLETLDSHFKVVVTKLNETLLVNDALLLIQTCIPATHSSSMALHLR